MSIVLCYNRIRTLGGITAILLFQLLSSMFATQGFSQTKYDRLFVFGDSYADSGVNSSNLFLGLGQPFPSSGMSVDTIAGQFDWVAYPYWLQESLGLSNGDVINYAIGGATTDIANFGGPALSLPFQVSTWGGQPFQKNDLIAVSIGGNDSLLAGGLSHIIGSGGPDGTAFDDAAAMQLGTEAAIRAAGAIEQFTNAGARNILFAGFSDVSLLPVTQLFPNQGSQKTFGESYFEGLQANLLPLAEAGARIFLVDQSEIGKKISNNLEAFNLETVAFAGSTETSLFLPDGVHYTNRGFEIISDYMVNIIQAPTIISTTSGVATSGASNFSNNVANHLDVTRRQDVSGKKHGLTAYTIGGYAFDQTGFNSAEYDLTSGTFGVETNFSKNVRGGLAFGFNRSRGDVLDDKIEDDAYLFAGYTSFNDGNLWVDAMVGYGVHDVHLNRTGIIENVYSDTDANTFSANIRSGYLFNFGKVSVGPFAGLRYLHTEVDAFSEQGDQLLAYNVAKQESSQKTAELGLQVRAPFTVLNKKVESYLGVSWKHEFGKDNRVVEASLVQSPLLPIKTDIDNFSSQNYGEISGGVSINLTEDLYTSITASSTFGKDDSDSFRFGTSLNYQF